MLRSKRHLSKKVHGKLYFEIQPEKRDALHVANRSANRSLSSPLVRQSPISHRAFMNQLIAARQLRSLTTPESQSGISSVQGLPVLEQIAAPLPPASSGRAKSS
jgi:hypothetical protein